MLVRMCCSMKAQIIAQVAAKLAIMNRYLFFINQLYSYSILRPLQQAIRRRGDDVAWFVQGTDDRYLKDDEKQLHSVSEVKSYHPEAVFVPGNWVPDFFPGVKVEVFHGLANDQTGKKGHFKVRGLFDLYCTHAPEGTRVFSDMAEQYGTFRVKETGWPKLDPLFCVDERGSHVKIPLQLLRDKIHTDKPIVFYASTFSPSLTSAPLLIDTIRRLSKHSAWHWLVTLHPKTPEDVVMQYRNMSGPDFTFIESNQDVLPLQLIADVMLCDTSSILLEFMLLNKPVVTFRTKMPGPHVIDVLDVDKIEAAIASALTRPDALLSAMKTYANNLHAYNDGKSSERVLAATDEFISNDKGRLKPKPLNLWRKMQMRKRMNYYRLS